MDQHERQQLLYAQLEKKILVIDGAMGTSIQSYNLTAEDFGGEHLEGCNDYLVITRPEVIREIHAAYFGVGAEAVRRRRLVAQTGELDAGGGVGQDLDQGHGVSSGAEQAGGGG